jgi:threonine synthase
MSQLCGKCSGILDVVYDKPVKTPIPGSSGSFWDYEALLPKSKYCHYLLESTSLVKSNEKRLWLKLELENPTRSFKDRGSIVEIAKALEYGYNEVVCASTGNMAYSIAYYARLSGIKAKVFISSNANRDKVRDIRETHDADITRVDGDFSKAQKLAIRYSEKNGVFLAGDYCYRKEGQRTIVYEILNQLKDATHIIAPVGNATLLSGMLKALDEMRTMMIQKRLPEVVGVQSSLCAPLFKAWKHGSALRYESPRTKADAIAVGFPTFGVQALGLLHRLKGGIITVSDAEMAREQKSFYKNYGLVAELAGVAGMAAYRKLGLKGDAKAVSVISGGNV